MDNQYSRDQLKVLALKDSIAKKVADYEEQVANLRVEVTILTNANEELIKQNEGLKAAAEERREERDVESN